MALQPVDRNRAKHAMKTEKRKAPTLVNRTNKRTFAELAPMHILVSRFNYGWNLHPKYCRGCKNPWCYCCRFY